jgi:hypothetical protein
MTTAVGISNFILVRYPPVLSSVYALAFGAGGIGLFAALAGDRITASAIPLLVTVTVTLWADLLIMRVIDDIRDQDYDRVANPQRPVASGAIQRRDLSALGAACTIIVVAANLFFYAGMVVIVGQLLYAAAVLAIGQRFPATRGDNLVLNVAIGFPVQLLLYVYLFVAYIEIRHDVPDAYVGALGILILTLCAGQVEFGKKLARRPAVGERSYTNSLGYRTTLLLTIGSGPLAVALFVVAADVSPLSKAFVALPTIGVVAIGIKYVSEKTNRWPAAVSALGLLGTLLAFAVVGTVG